MLHTVHKEEPTAQKMDLESDLVLRRPVVSVRFIVNVPIFREFTAQEASR